MIHGGDKSEVEAELRRQSSGFVFREKNLMFGIEGCEGSGIWWFEILLCLGFRSYKAYM